LNNHKSLTIPKTGNGTHGVSVPKVDYDRVLELGRELLVALGEDPEREGLRETPERWASWWKEFIDYQEDNTDTTFNAITTDQMVTISGMRVWSVCEHHLLPFWADVSIGYIVHEKVLGLSKFARIAHKAAHGLQLQERLTNEIAEEVMRVTGSPDVIVSADGMHLCMMMRGIRTEATVSSLTTRGVFKDRSDLRAEFLRMAEHSARTR
jgi:GTP cyclohydrolase I